MKTMGKRDFGGSLEGGHLSQKKLRAEESTRDDSVSDHVEESVSVWLFMRSSTADRQHMYVANVGEGGCLHMLRELEDRNWNNSAGYEAVGSRIYVIGGDLKTNRDEYYPKDVIYYDVSDAGDGGIITWQVGPSLLAGKPNPMVVTVKGKIYALAGVCRYSYGEDWYGNWTDIPDPLFEVLDPLGDGGKGKWEALDNPPFMSFFRDRGPEVRSHTVVGSTIYMHVVAPCRTGPEFLFSYDTEHRIWKKHGSVSSTSCVEDDLIVDNLRIAYWQWMGDVVGKKMYQCRFLGPSIEGNRVFAIDLAARDKKMEDYDSDDDLDDLVVKLPIHGLKYLTDEVPHDTDSESSGFMTHLVENKFCLFIVYFHSKMKKQVLRVCTFEVHEEGSCGERSLHAKNVIHQDYDLYKFADLTYYRWLKVRCPRLSC